jgi:hypothetical protein
MERKPLYQGSNAGQWSPASSTVPLKPKTGLNAPPSSSAAAPIFQPRKKTAEATLEFQHKMLQAVDLKHDRG